MTHIAPLLLKLLMKTAYYNIQLLQSLLSINNYFIGANFILQSFSGFYRKGDMLQEPQVH